MKILLTAINAKYIHSNPAIYDLKIYSSRFQDSIELAEYTINQYREDIVGDIYKRKPDVLAISCYIWNIGLVTEVIRDINRICPQLPIWLGGPEVSYDAQAFMKREPEVTGIMIGEGEQTFQELMEYYIEEKGELGAIKGLAWRAEGIVKVNPSREVMDLNSLPFPYTDMQNFEHKIVYYESSRGCPFSCSYCLSSIDKNMRFRNVETVKKELAFFLSQKVEQVKFVDRTFNAKREHALDIWRFIQEQDNGVTNFHFEVSADLIDEEELQLLSKMRPGLVQLEIGVQSVNQDTLRAIRRKMDLKKLIYVVNKIHRYGNIHQHLDLIAGLPYENYESFRRSFLAVHCLDPQQLQLGFLKVLKGSDLQSKAEEYGIVYSQTPPYEVLHTKWISYEEICKLKEVEAMVETYYNSGQFRHSLSYVLTFYENPFDFYLELSQFYVSGGLEGMSHSRMARYELLKDFVLKRQLGEEKRWIKMLTLDLYARENLKSRPEWINDQQVYKERVYDFYKQEERSIKYLENGNGYSWKQLMKMTHLEIFEGDSQELTGYLFDYSRRNPLNKEAFIQVVTL